MGSCCCKSETEIIAERLLQAPEENPLTGRTFLARAVCIHDGHSFDAVIEERDQFRRFRARLWGFQSEPAAIVGGQRMMQLLTNKIMGALLELDCLGLDEYGRVICKVYVCVLQRHDSVRIESVSDYMVTSSKPLDTDSKRVPPLQLGWL